MKITCQVCGSKHAMCGSITQGSGCAASTYFENGQWFIRGHYGSRQHDMRLYRITPTLVGWYGLDPVCDTCIDRELAAGNLVRIAGYFLEGEEPSA